MCTYDKRIMCKINKSLLLTSLIIILIKQSYCMEAQNHEKKLCSSLTEYLIENDFDKDKMVYIFNEQQRHKCFQGLVGKPPLLVETLHKQLVDRYKSGKCQPQIDDYNLFNEMYTKRNPYTKNLKCDWIRPKIPNTLDIICKHGLGQYFLQHGTRVYHHFLKYLTQKKNSKNEKKIPEKEQKQWINNKTWIEYVSKLPFVGNNVMLVAEHYINAYYHRKDCDMIVNDYNAYYDFFMEKYKDIHPNNKYNYYRESCDWFRRLNSQHKFIEELIN
ncbi:Hypothetical protein CINCED_3A022356 [Cinara cedri]|uniref:Uncharacterized protein n=1 Tax=Cinara cedri TaxID=506608 RepID=A0A5E4MMR7_9HEMI|nr:Hypothetical protein CINCED_3A022356 [Cinara cedri]